ncbi:MAG: GEVED domain-containing protein, partial [Anaerolineae bacterium]
HFGVPMTAYPAGGPPGVGARYPTVFDPATGIPQGPKHWGAGLFGAWLGLTVTHEFDADLMPDVDGVTNIDPPPDFPDQDRADDALLPPLILPDCVTTTFEYTVTVKDPGIYLVNVWFDWNRDGDWEDILPCGHGPAPEWAVQNQVLNLPPGVHRVRTPAFLPSNPTPDQEMWMRMTLTIEGEPPPPNPDTELPDGRGPDIGYDHGETEDYYLPGIMEEDLGDLGDAPDSTNHFGVNMTAYPAGGPPGIGARYPTVFDPATGLPQGPKHFGAGLFGAWLGFSVTQELDADLFPDVDGITNLDPPPDFPDRDGADDALIPPLILPDCVNTTFEYTVTVKDPGDYLVNVWFDWIRDGDWDDVPECPDGNLAPEWAVQNQLLSFSAPGVYKITTPAFLPFNPTPDLEMWMRLTLTRDGEYPPLNPQTDMADGRGPGIGYDQGETEDYYLPGIEPGLPEISKHLIQPASGVAAVSDTVTFGIVVTNSTLNPLVNLVVDDHFDSSCLSYLPPAVPPPTNVTTGTLSWTIPLLNPGKVWSATINFHADAPCGVTTNTAMLPQWLLWDDATVTLIPEEPEPIFDLGDAPDSTNHHGVTMTAYLLGGGPPDTQAHYPTVFDPATGLPPGPRHFNPSWGAWLGLHYTLELDADVMPDADGVPNIVPPSDLPDWDVADDAIHPPLKIPHCVSTTFEYTVTVGATGAGIPFYVNAWFDWNRDGDWQDRPECDDGSPAPEWAVQNQMLNFAAPGVYTVTTPAFLPHNTEPKDSMWMRITLAEMPINPQDMEPDGQGPRSGYEGGETEDYYLPGWEDDPLVDIFIRDHLTDTGTIPTTYPPGWWRSPDIWVRHSDDGNTAHQNPELGETNYVNVNVHHRLGVTATNVVADLYWGNVAMGFPWPTGWNYIGSVNIGDLPPGVTSTEVISWNVPNIGGHFCFLARTSATEDPITDNRVQWDNNIAQRNFNIVDDVPQRSCGMVTSDIQTNTVTMDVVNTLAITTAVDVVLDSSTFPTTTGAISVDMGNMWGDWTSLSNFNQVGMTLVPTAFPARINGIALAPYAQEPMTTTIVAPGNVDFSVNFSEEIGGEKIGGVDYYQNIPSCLYLPLLLRSSP